MYQAIKKLTAARTSAGGLAGNDHTHVYVASTAYAWSRASGNLIVLTTNSGSSSNAQHCFNSQKANGQWTDVFSGSSTVITSDGNGQVCVTVSNGNPIVLLATTATTNSAVVDSVASTPTTLLTSAVTATSTTCPTSVSVTFSESVTTVVGDTVKIVGNTTQLGSWTASSGQTLSASSYTASNPVWTITLPMTPGSAVQYKFVKVSSSGTVSWESDPNRAYSVPACQASASVSTTWQ
jgi:alpha-amylase